jgi:hypothetical protein|nr:hypothetical protein Q903MT_gene2652 [Picea sitchensis]
MKDWNRENDELWRDHRRWVVGRTNGKTRGVRRTMGEGHPYLKSNVKVWGEMDVGGDEAGEHPRPAIDSTRAYSCPWGMKKGTTSYRPDLL